MANKFVTKIETFLKDLEADAKAEEVKLVAWFKKVFEHHQEGTLAPVSSNAPVSQPKPEDASGVPNDEALKNAAAAAATK
jgi:hypothetical protein